jgi:hypothetical protein
MGKTWKLLVGFAVVVDKKNAFLVIFVNVEDSQGLRVLIRAAPAL